jgi:hypothetical protein
MDYGTFMPKSLRELGLTDPFYGSNPNVSPVYRFRVWAMRDDNLANDTVTKFVRFYLQRSAREMMVSVENYTPGNALPSNPTQLSNKLNSDTLLAALDSVRWFRADGSGKEDYDLFERDKWPSTGLDFKAWSTVIWEQGSDSEGLLPEERAALKAMLNNTSSWVRPTLIMAGQDVARKHDVALSASNGMIADQDFVQNYLRAAYVGPTNPAVYSNKKIRGLAINPGKYEELEPTRAAGDAAPMPGVLRTTPGSGIARAAYTYVDQTASATPLDSVAGVASAAARNVVYYAFDWRHAGRYDFEPLRSGAQRLLLGALDFADQYHGVLPVKLLSFEAFQSGRQAVAINWTTAEEINVAGLEIERAVVTRSESGENVGSYQLVDRQTPKGSATGGSSYNVIDRGVDMGVEYSYRLVSVNLEGTRTVEAVRTVKVLGGSAAEYSLTVLPNPIRGTGRIVYHVPADQKVRVALYDELGRQVKELVAGSGSGEVTLTVGDLASGSYTARLETSSGVVAMERVTIQK